MDRLSNNHVVSSSKYFWWLIPMHFFEEFQLEVLFRLQTKQNYSLSPLKPFMSETKIFCLYLMPKCCVWLSVSLKNFCQKLNSISYQNSILLLKPQKRVRWEVDEIYGPLKSAFEWTKLKYTLSTIFAWWVSLFPLWKISNILGRRKVFKNFNPVLFYKDFYHNKYHVWTSWISILTNWMTLVSQSLDLCLRIAWTNSEGSGATLHLNFTCTYTVLIYMLRTFFLHVVTGIILSPPYITSFFFNKYGFTGDPFA